MGDPKCFVTHSELGWLGVARLHRMYVFFLLKIFHCNHFLSTIPEDEQITKIIVVVSVMYTQHGLWRVLITDGSNVNSQSIFEQNLKKNIKRFQLKN